MRETDFFLLLYVAKRTSLNGALDSSTGEIAHHLQLSQQSVSRKLRNLEGQGLIKRKVSPTGIEITIASEGAKLLRSHFLEMKKLFATGGKEKTTLEGTVESGLGEGSYYTSRPQYKKQFAEKLSFKPVDGTLNMKVNEQQLGLFLQESTQIYIKGFKTKERTFGGINCRKARINNSVDGALIIPERSNYPSNIVEIIAPVSLRRKFNLRDGQKITLVIK